MSGVYICANIEAFNEPVKKALSSMGELTGGKVGADKLHSTIVYSTTSIDVSLADVVLDQVEPPFKARIIAAASFDALPSDDGKRDVSLATIVLLLESNLLTSLHQTFRSIGASHSYLTYDPHVSVWYNVPRELAKEAVDRLNAALEGQNLWVTITGFHMEPLDDSDNWVANNTKERSR